jgi:hypothetical protein
LGRWQDRQRLIGYSRIDWLQPNLLARRKKAMAAVAARTTEFDDMKKVGDDIIDIEYYWNQCFPFLCSHKL